MEKQYCSTHPQQPITNFCRRIQCLQELCPVCICSHSQKHETMKTLPQYEPIGDTFRNCQKLIHQLVSSIGHSKNRVVQHKLEWENKKKSAIDKIDSAEQQTLSTVIKTFDYIKYSLNCRIEEYERQIGFQNSQQFASIINVYDSQINQLNECSEQLASSKPAYIKILLNQVLPKNQQFMESVEKDLLRGLSKSIVVNRDLEKVKQEVENCIRTNMGFGLESQPIKIVHSSSTIVLPLKRELFMHSSSVTQNNCPLIVTNHLRDSDIFSAKCCSTAQKTLNNTHSALFFETQPQHSRQRGQQNSQKAHMSATAVAPFAMTTGSLTKLRKSIFVRSHSLFRA